MLKGNNYTKYIYFTLFIIFIVYVIELISQVIIYQIGEFKFYLIPSDLKTHIYMSVTGHEKYSLLFITFGYIFQIFHNQVSIAVFIILIIFATIYLSAYYLNNNTDIKSIYICLIFAILIYIESAIYIPELSDKRHLGLFASGVWHNSSLLAMKLMAIIFLMLIANILNKLNNNIPLKISDYLIFTFTAFISTWIKPNLTFVIYPALCIISIILFIKNKKLFKELFLLLMTFLPSIAILYTQSKIMYSNGNTNEVIGFSPFFFINHHYNINNLPILLVFLTVTFQSFLFPISALMLLYNKLKHVSTYLFVWIASIISVIQAIVLIETGWRKTHGNWTWAAYTITFLLFLVTTKELVNITPDIWKNGTLIKKILLIFVYITLLVHIVYGFMYMHILLKGIIYA